MMIKKMFLGLLLMQGCASMPEGTRELDRRSGLTPSYQKEDDAQVVETMRSERTLGREATMPARIEPLIEKVWVYDLILEGGHWLQGTWIFVEIERSRWLPEIDKGYTPLLRGKDI